MVDVVDEIKGRCTFMMLILDLCRPRVASEKISLVGVVVEFHLPAGFGI